MNRLLGVAFGAVLFAVSAFSQVSIKAAGGWLETAYVKWAPVSGAGSYNVYYTGGGVTNQKIDNPLIRSYGSYYRADVLGIPAGSYTIKVVPVVNGAENTTLAATTQSLTVLAHNREGFAFSNGVVPGAYNANGTPKSGAKIIYITANTANTVTCDVINEKGVAVSITGITAILLARDKGWDKTPLIIRMVGLIKKNQINNLPQGGIYIAFIGATSTTRKTENITFEGVGDDATAYGYGFFTKRSKSIEIRNVGIMMFGDDAISMESENSNIWVHNCDFFYGTPGSDDDQVKGDGSIDMKYSTSYITISFNHFWDSGKSTFAGGATEPNLIYFTYHHNWFDHSDSRHPRLCFATAHVYNNYCDGAAKMGVVSTENTSAFVEANYFRYCQLPMMINMQGTNYDKWPDGTQGGGIIKAYNNKIEGAKSLIYQAERPDDFDAYLVTSRDEKIPSTVKSRKGGNTYSNFDTDPTMYTSIPDSPDDVKSIVPTYAGRVCGGDFKWTFNNTIDDTMTIVNAALKTAILEYKTTLVSVQGDGPTVISGGNKPFPAALPTQADISLKLVANILSVSTKASVTGVKIYSTTGALVQAADTKTLNLSNVANGTYLIVVSIGKYQVTKQFIKK